MNRWINPLLIAIVSIGAAQVAVADGQAQGKSQDKDGHKGGPNHGQIVSECNHRANDRNLKGQERKDFVEWCESRGARHQFDDKRYEGEKNCYRKANNKGLTGDKRSRFLEKCFGGGDDKYDGGKVPASKKD